ncbi:MAG: prepilin-type N-terminal cleavage/methylation domain-containing protein, partial [Pirellulales bacterium]|nr:prepilin-type N-terminal cleavage/methylation domain-containing protein [Pirellulales bacterium]
MNRMAAVDETFLVAGDQSQTAPVRPPAPANPGDFARPRTSLGRPRAFTLIEVVLAVALSTVVIYLLTTAVQLYLLRVDSGRSRVESAQLARTLLDRIAADLAATRITAQLPAAAAQTPSTTSQPPAGPSVAAPG